MLNGRIKYFQAAVLFGTLLSASVLQADVVTMQSMDEVARKFSELLRRTPAQEMLGVFEIDMVLLQPSEPALQVPSQRTYQVFLQKMLANLSPQQHDILLDLVAKRSKSISVNQQNPKIIKKIAAQGVKLLAVSSSLTGSIGTIPRFEVWRYNDLKSVGIDFSRSFAHIPEINFSEVPAYYARLPVFYKGVLCSNGQAVTYNTAAVLVKFLQKAKFQPQSVIFVGASKQQVMQFESALKAFNKHINFIGIHYLAAESYASGPVEQADFVKAWEKMIEDAKHLSVKM